MLTLANVGDITGRNDAPESSIGGETVHVHRVHGSPEDALGRAMRPSVRVWRMRGANAAVPLLSRAGASVV